MSTQVQIRGAAQSTQEARTLAVRELDINTTDKRISIHDGSTVGGIPHANYADIQNQEWTYAAASGTDAIAITLNKAPSAYLSGQRFSFKAANTNTGSATLNVNSLGAKTIKKVFNGSIVVLEAGDIIQNAIYEVGYDGTDMILLGAGGGNSGRTTVYEQVTTTALSAIEVPNIFEAGYNYEITVSRFVPAVDGSTPFFQFGNGTTWLNTASAYIYALQGYTSAAARADAGASASSISLSGTGVGTATNESSSFKITCHDPVETTHANAIQWSGGYRDASANEVVCSGYGQAAAASYSSFRVGFLAGSNVEAGAKIVVERYSSGG